MNLITYGLLEKEGWRQGDKGNTFHKNGFCLWKWDYWALEKSPKAANERAIPLGIRLNTIEEVNKIIAMYEKKYN